MIFHKGFKTTTKWPLKVDQIASSANNIFDPNYIFFLDILYLNLLLFDWVHGNGLNIENIYEHNEKNFGVNSILTWRRRILN